MHVKIIALEGMNRSGKGTQAELLKTKLGILGFKTVVLRGDGSRPGLGKTLGDPIDFWWQSFHELLSQLPEADKYHLWDKAAVKIAFELIEWKNRMQVDNNAFIILDRSLISRFSIACETRPNCHLHELYIDTEGKNISNLWKLVCPDLFFFLNVSKQELLRRLDSEDPKILFRRSLIENKYDWLLECLARLPTPLFRRTVIIEGHQDPSVIRDNIMSHLLG